jgi:hypothetical protein
VTMAPSARCNAATATLPTHRGPLRNRTHKIRSVERIGRCAHTNEVLVLLHAFGNAATCVPRHEGLLPQSLGMISRGANATVPLLLQPCGSVLRRLDGLVRECRHLPTPIRTRSHATPCSPNHVPLACRIHAGAFLTRSKSSSLGLCPRWSA